jgi:hypothetical protein
MIPWFTSIPEPSALALIGMWGFDANAAIGLGIPPDCVMF